MILRWSHPEERAVLEDRLLERGKDRPPLAPYYSDYGGGGYGYGGDGDGDYGGGGGGGGYGYGGDGGYGDGGGGGGGGGYGYGGDGGGGYGYGDGDGGKKAKSWESVMREGLQIVVTPGGYVPYVRIAWARRIEGDEWMLYGARVICSFGRNQQLANLAVKGPASDTVLLDPSPSEDLHRLHAIRTIPADERAWRADCPKPEGWR